MNSNNLPRLLNTATELYILYQNEGNEWVFTQEYVNDISLLESGWDFHWVSSSLAGVVSQIAKGKKEITNVGCLDQLGSFCFISDEVLDQYFPEPEKCPIFIGHLFLMQSVLEICISKIKNFDRN